MVDLMIDTDGNAPAHTECFSPDYPRVVSATDGRSFIEVTHGDPTDTSDPCEIEVQEFDGFGEVTIARVRPDAAGLSSLIMSLLAELQRMNGCAK